jgi:hypothetical protein
MRLFLGALAALGLGALGWAVCGAGEGEKKTRVFELRVYTAAPGKMKALHARFRDHTNKLFKKHGMEIIGFWTPDKPEEADKTLIYLLAFPSRQAAARSWQAFRNDPQWKRVKEASEKDGTLVKKVESTYLDPTDYSPLK